MGDTDTATSVRGKGWVTFDDSTDGAVSSSSPRRLSQSEQQDTPGSLEVSSAPESALHQGVVCSPSPGPEVVLVWWRGRCEY